VPGVADRLKTLSNQVSIHLLTAGTHGKLLELEGALGFPLHVVNKGDEKMRYVQQLGPASTIAFGNGMNDSGMLRLASIGVAILAPEGTATRAWQAADLLVYGPINALDLLLKPMRLVATLRG
jgi:soluble P-type ATPase